MLYREHLLSHLHLTQRQDVLVFHAALEDHTFPKIPGEYRARCDELGMQIYNPMEDTGAPTIRNVVLFPSFKCKE
jgi:hypothetical protein